MRSMAHAVIGFLGGIALGVVAAVIAVYLWYDVFRITQLTQRDDHSAMDWLLVGALAGGAIGAVWLGRRARHRRRDAAVIVFALLSVPALLYLLVVTGLFGL